MVGSGETVTALKIVSVCYEGSLLEGVVLEWVVGKNLQVWREVRGIQSTRGEWAWSYKCLKVLQATDLRREGCCRDEGA